MRSSTRSDRSRWFVGAVAVIGARGSRFNMQRFIEKWPGHEEPSPYAKFLSRDALGPGVFLNQGAARLSVASASDTDRA